LTQVQFASMAMIGNMAWEMQTDIAVRQRDILD
jgi:hypothetical protein